MKLKTFTPWKESYDQTRQHIKKQRCYFANKSPSSQGYSFSHSHVWMWELDYKESYQFSSVAQSCQTLCHRMNCSTPGLSVHHQLLEFTQTHFHWVGDAIQPSHPLSSPSPALNLSQHQGLFKWVSSLHQVAKVLEFQLQLQFQFQLQLPMNTQDWSSLEWTGWMSLQSKGFSRVFSNTIVQKYKFFGTQISL